MTARKRAPGHATPLRFAPGPAAEPQATSGLPPSTRVIITGTGRKRLHTLKAIPHPDETGRPCLFTSPPSGHPLRSPLHGVSGPAAQPQAISALPRYVTIMLPDED